MPHLVRIYLHSAVVGLLLACCFVAALLALDVAHLRHLMFSSGIGWLAVAIMIAFNAILFGGVQFAITIMGQAETQPPTKGRRRMIGIMPPRYVLSSVPATTRQR